MSRYGLGFGAQAAARPSRGGSPADGAAVIAPGAGWSGTSGSGFGGSLPADPVRVTAKPALRLLTPPRQAFTSTQLVGVIGGANDEGTLIDNLGIEKVTVHFEGASIDIDAPSLRSFADANGNTVRYFGWWAVLQRPTGMGGAADIYFEAVPRDASMQNRVIGPFTYFPVAQRYDFSLEVAATAPEVAGSRYQTLQDALGYLRAQSALRPRITIVETGTYDLETSALPYEFESWCEITASVPVTISRPAPDAGEGYRPRRGPLRFIGSNITIDFVRSANIRAENDWGDGTWVDGVTLTNSAGRDTLRFKDLHSRLNHILSGGGWMTECNVTNLLGNGSEIQLARGNTFTDSWGDILRATDCSVGNTLINHDSSFYRSYLDALDVSYSGGGSATLEMSGSNNSTSRVIDAKVDGVSVGTFATAIGKAAFDADTNYTIENVRDWLNSLSGWSATARDTTRLAASLQADGTIGPWGPVAIGLTPATLKTFFDVHADVFQYLGAENVCIFGNTGYGMNGQILFLDDGAYADVIFINNAFDNTLPVGNLSQLSYPQSHVVVAHNANSTQRLALRTDLSGGQAYDPDEYCLIANNAFPSLNWSSASDADLVIAFNHLGSGAIIPEGAIGTSTGGSAVGNYSSAATGDFTPRGALLAYPKPPAVRFDSAGNARRSPVAPVGAVRGPVGSDVIAPLITSADPSGTYFDGGLIQGQLTADEPVTWLVSGQDSAFVGLDPDTGVWSVGPTDHASKSSYAFTFEAIDAAGNGSSQPVALAISSDAGNGPVLTGFTDDADGSSGANLSVETDTADGLLYWAVTADGSTPDANAIKSGAGFAASGSQAVSAAGVQAIAIAGLAASTSYVAHIVHTSASGADSPVERGDGFATMPSGSQADAIILLVAGQSNARKASTDPAAVPSRYTSLYDVHQWIAASGAPAPYMAGTNSGHRGAEGEWGTEAERIYQMREAGEARPIYVAKEAVNGNALASVGGGDWDPANSGERFEGLENQVADLRTWLETNTPHTTFEEETLWNQGEADATNDADANAYAVNWSTFLAAYRNRISTGFFIAERIRPLGFGPSSSVATPQGFARAYTVREATIAGILADGNGAVIDTDFHTGNFLQVHPAEPDPWTIDSWTTQIGLRAHAARTGTYNATYGSITDAVPDAFSVPAASGEAASQIASALVPVTGIERRAAVSLSNGLEMRVLNSDGSVHTDWTSDDSALFVDKFQSFMLRAAAPAAGTTETHSVTIGGVASDWQLTGAAASNYRADTQSWLDALASAGGTSLSPAQAGGLDAFLAALDAAGLLGKIGGHIYALGSEVANTIRLDDPTLIATQEGVTDLPWANGYKSTDNNQIVDLKASPSALTELNSIAITLVLNELGVSTSYIVGSDDATIGLSVRGSSVRFRAHSAHATFNGFSMTKLGAYTATSDGATARLYDPDGIEIASKAISPNASKTAMDFTIGGASTTDRSNRLWGVAIGSQLTAGEIGTLHSELQTLRALF